MLLLLHVNSRLQYRLPPVLSSSEPAKQQQQQVKHLWQHHQSVLLQKILLVRQAA
jgi:hypothetical protein